MAGENQEEAKEKDSGKLIFFYGPLIASGFLFLLIIIAGQFGEIRTETAGQVVNLIFIFTGFALGYKLLGK